MIRHRTGEGFSRLMTSISVAAVLAIALVARLVPTGRVFTEQGVRFAGDADALYHVLRAERLLRGHFAAAWFDPNISFPDGADLLWPPALDALLAALTRLVAGPSAGRDSLELVASFLPPVVALACVALVMRLAWHVAGITAALVAGLVFAVLPVCVEFGVVGRPDHHVLELGVFLFSLVAYLEAQHAESSRAWQIALGIATALGAWVWQGSTLHVAFLGGCAAATWAIQPRGVSSTVSCLRTVRTGMLVAATLVAATLLAFGPSGALRSASLRGLTAFHAGAMLGAGLFCGALVPLASVAWSRTVAKRIALLVCAGAAAAAGAIALAPDAAAHGLSYVGRGDPLLETIREMQPAFFGPRSSFSHDLAWVAFGIGPALLAPPLAITALRSRWRTQPERREALLIVALGASLFGALFLGRAVRFHLYWAPFLASCSGLIVARLHERSPSSGTGTRQPTWLAFAATAAFLLPAGSLNPRAFGRAADEPTVEVLRWLGAFSPGRDRAVLAPWTFGHAAQYYAGLPVISSPFGTDVGDAAFRAQASFYYAASSDSAEAVLNGRRVGFVLLSGHLDPLSDARAFAPTGSPALVDIADDYWGEGRRVRTVEAYGESMPGWLYEYDGVPLQRGRTTGIPFLRLVYETGGVDPLKLFEVVRGATVAISGAFPGTRVAVHVDVTTNQGRPFHWWAWSVADAEGCASIRVPYATGRNGATTVSRVRIKSNVGLRDLIVAEADVTHGGMVAVQVSSSTTAMPGERL
jgi:asparagine N-glycosylation enzyme membrane subunit Stt3